VAQRRALATASGRRCCYVDSRSRSGGTKSGASALVVSQRLGPDGQPVADLKTNPCRNELLDPLPVASPASSLPWSPAVSGHRCSEPPAESPHLLTSPVQAGLDPEIDDPEGRIAQPSEDSLASAYVRVPQQGPKNWV
jgi:hypothetical protein